MPKPLEIKPNLLFINLLEQASGANGTVRYIIIKANLSHLAAVDPSRDITYTYIYIIIIGVFVQPKKHHCILF